MPVVKRLGDLLVLGVALSLMGGCANESRLAAREQAGWRQGWVYRIVEGKDLAKNQSLDCISALDPDRIVAHRFAMVWYAVSIGARRHLLRTVEIPDSLELGVWDTVQINIRDCEQPIARIAR